MLLLLDLGNLGWILLKEFTKQYETLLTEKEAPYHDKAINDNAPNINVTDKF